MVSDAGEGGSESATNFRTPWCPEINEEYWIMCQSCHIQVWCEQGWGNYLLVTKSVPVRGLWV